MIKVFEILEEEKQEAINIAKKKASNNMIENFIKAGELCKDSEGNVYVCQYPVGTAPDTWGYYKIPDNLLERLNKLIDFEGTGK